MVIQAAVNQETSTVFRFLPILYRSAKIRCLNLHLIRTACKCFRSSSHFRSRYGNSRVWKKSYCPITGFPPFANLCCRGREPNQLRAPKRGAWRPRTWWGRRGYRLRWRRRPTRPRGRRCPSRWCSRTLGLHAVAEAAHQEAVTAQSTHHPSARAAANKPSQAT